jgi:hypothetical protein
VIVSSIVVYLRDDPIPTATAVLMRVSAFALPILNVCGPFWLWIAAFRRRSRKGTGQRWGSTAEQRFAACDPAFAMQS